MTWTDELSLTKKQALVVLKKNKEIKPIENITNAGNVTVKDNVKEQASAFREIVAKARKVKGK